jgi:hypothetical protein
LQKIILKFLKKQKSNSKKTLSIIKNEKKRKTSFPFSFSKGGICSFLSHWSQRSKMEKINRKKRKRKSREREGRKRQNWKGRQKK